MKFCRTLVLTFSFLFSNWTTATPIYVKAGEAKLVARVALELIEQHKTEIRQRDKIFANTLLHRYADARTEIERLYNDSQKFNPWVTPLYTFQYSTYLDSLDRAQQEGAPFEPVFERIFSQFVTGFDRQYVNYIDEYYAHNIANLRRRLDRAIQSLEQREDVRNKTNLVSIYYQWQMISDTKSIASKILRDFANRNLTQLDAEIIPLSNGDSLQAKVYLPKQRTSNKLPAILIYNLYATGWNIDNKAIEAAMKGYAGIVVYPRGKGNSTGSVQPFLTEYEDGYDIIEWISKQKWSDGRVGMFGGSYLGFAQWAVTKKLHPALKTLVPSTAVVPGFNDNLTVNGILKAEALPWFHLVTNTPFMDFGSYYDSAWGNLYRDFYREGHAFNALNSLWKNENAAYQNWLGKQGNDEYWQQFFPSGRELAKLNIPILATTGYFDHAQAGTWHYFLSHLAANPNLDHHILVGPYEHLGASSMPSNRVGNYTLDSQAHININSLIFDWFDYVFNGKEKPSLIKKQINFQVMGANRWAHMDHQELMALNSNRFYLQKTGVLGTAKTGKQSALSLSSHIAQTIDLNDRDSQNRPISTFKNLEEAASSNNLVYLSAPLVEDTTISGFLQGQLHLEINKQDADIGLGLYEVTAEGEVYLLSEYKTRLSYNGFGKSSTLIKPGKPTVFDIKGDRFTSKRLPTGSRLMLVAGGVKEARSEINYGVENTRGVSLKDDMAELKIKWFESSYIDLFRLN